MKTRTGHLLGFVIFLPAVISEAAPVVQKSRVVKNTDVRLQAIKMVSFPVKRGGPVAFLLQSFSKLRANKQ